MQHSLVVTSRVSRHVHRCSVVRLEEKIREKELRNVTPEARGDLNPRGTSKPPVSEFLNLSQAALPLLFFNILDVPRTSTPPRRQLRLRLRYLSRYPLSIPLETSSCDY